MFSKAIISQSAYQRKTRRELTLERIQYKLCDLRQESITHCSSSPIYKTLTDKISETFFFFYKKVIEFSKRIPSGKFSYSLESKSSIVMSACFRAWSWIRDCFTVSFCQQGCHKGVSEQMQAFLGERSQCKKPQCFVLPPQAPPQSILQHTGMGTVGRLKEQRKIGNKINL